MTGVFLMRLGSREGQGFRFLSQEMDRRSSEARTDEERGTDHERFIDTDQVKRQFSENRTEGWDRVVFFLSVG